MRYVEPTKAFQNLPQLSFHPDAQVARSWWLGVEGLTVALVQRMLNAPHCYTLSYCSSSWDERTFHHRSSFDTLLLR